MDVLNLFDGMSNTAPGLVPPPSGSGGHGAGVVEGGSGAHGAPSADVAHMIGADVNNEELLPFLDGDLELSSMYLSPTDSLAVPSAPIHVPTAMGVGSVGHLGSVPTTGLDMGAVAAAHAAAAYRLGAPGVVGGGPVPSGGSDIDDESSGKAVDTLELLSSSPTTTYGEDEQLLQVPVAPLGGVTGGGGGGGGPSVVAPSPPPRSPASVGKPPLRSPSASSAAMPAAGAAKRVKPPPVRKSASSNKLVGTPPSGSSAGIAKAKAAAVPSKRSMAAAKRSSVVAKRAAAAATTVAAAAAAAASRGGEDDGSTAGDDSDSMSVAPPATAAGGGDAGATAASSAASAEPGVRGMRKDVHNSHTRKCRAKVNTKFDELLTLLPPHPDSFQVKHKAQILDYTIHMYKRIQARKNQLEAELALSTRANLAAWVDTVVASSRTLPEALQPYLHLIAVQKRFRYAELWVPRSTAGESGAEGKKTCATGVPGSQSFRSGDSIVLARAMALLLPAPVPSTGHTDTFSLGLGTSAGMSGSSAAAGSSGTAGAGASSPSISSDALAAAAAAEEETTRAIEEFRDATASCVVPPRVGMPGRVYCSMRPEWLPILSDPHAFIRAEYAAKSPLSMCLAVPVLLCGRVAAVAAFFDTGKRPYDASVVGLAHDVANLVGNAFGAAKATGGLH
ncbi:hypothetical protein MMPV_006095 [Pyropia vietnamensis]